MSPKIVSGGSDYDRGGQSCGSDGASQNQYGSAGASPYRRSVSYFMNRLYVVLMIVVLLTFGLYLRTVTFDFVSYDDGVYVTNNPKVNEGLSWAGLRYAFTTGETGTWQPLTLLSHMLDCSLYGLRAGGHHITNAILHALNTLLLGIALYRLTGAAGPSLICAAIFGLHPLHVESVAWVSERKDVLSTFFFMSTLLAYQAWTNSLHKGWLAVVFALTTFGLLAKPMLVTLPCVLLLLDYWPLCRLHEKNRVRCISLLVLEKSPLFAAAAVVSATTLYFQHGASAVSGINALPWSARVENALMAYIRYIAKTLWPSDLMIYYPHPLGMTHGLVVGIATAALVGITAVVWLNRRRAPYLLVGWLWYIGTLVPVIGLIQVGTQAIADRYTYIPMIGLTIMVAWGVQDIVTRAARPFVAPIAFASIATGIALLSILTWNQIGVWRNSETLYRHTHAIMPDNPVANMGLGLTLVRANRYADAIPFLEQALKADHRTPEAHYSLGLAEQNLGHTEIALQHYQSAVKLDPGNSLAWNNLGVLLAGLGKPAEAFDALQRAVETGPMNSEAVANFGAMLIQSGQAAEAETLARAAIDRMPYIADMHNLLGVALSAQHRNGEAADAFRTALAIDNKHAEAQQNLDALRAGQP